MTTLDSTDRRAGLVVDLDAEAPRPGGGVVVGYDGSPPSLQALAWAADEAAARSPHLTVLHAADIGGLVPGEAWAAARDEDREELRTVVADLSRAREGLDVHGALSLAGPTQVLLAASADADLVVVGSRGRGRISSAMLGSVVLSVSAAAACPVVVVRGREDRRPGPEHPVVVGVSDQDRARAAVALAAEVAQRHQAGLIVLAACQGPEVLGRHGLPRARRRHSLFLGSTSHAVIHGARCPVAVVRAARGRGGGQDRLRRRADRRGRGSGDDRGGRPHRSSG